MTTIQSTLLENGRVALRSPFEAKDAVKALPGSRWNPDRKHWHIPATPESVRALVEMTQGKGYELTIDPGVQDLLDAAREAYMARANRHATDLPPIPGETGPETWLHQRQAYHFAVGQHSAGLAVGMGGGKTRIATHLLDGWEARKALIVTTPNGLGVWPDQLGKWSQRGWKVAYNGGLRRDGKPYSNPSTAQRRAHAEATIDAAHRASVPAAVVIHWHVLPHLKKWLLAQDWDVVVLDESHNAKTPGGVWAKTVEQLSRHAKRRLCLTGTLMPQSILDAFSQTRFLDPGIFGTSFARHRNEFAIMGGYGGYEVLGFRNQDLHEQMLARVWYVATEEDMALGLPETHHVRRTFKLSDAAQKVYTDLLRDSVVQLGDGAAASAPLALTKLLRFAQITGGHLPADDGEMLARVDTGKEDLLLETLEGIDPHEPVVVMARFRADLDVIKAVAEKLGRTYGEVSGRRRDLQQPGSKYPEGVQVLGVQIQAGSEAIDLTAAAYCVYYSVGFDNGKYQQSLKRVHRPGQTRPTTYFHLVAEGTVDEVEYAALESKQDAADAALAHIRQEAAR